MTDREILELAREAGLYVGTNISGVMLVGAAKSNGLLLHMTADDLERFAALVRAQALEEAAGVCEEFGEWRDTSGVDCADAIRALKTGEQK